jgi:catechol O-methyltransferase
LETSFLEYVLANTPKNDPNAIISAINKYCEQTWMPSIGE